jgi:hypothetical protein
MSSVFTVRLEKLPEQQMDILLSNGFFAEGIIQLRKMMPECANQC